MDTFEQWGGAWGEIEVFTPNRHELGYGWKKITKTETIQKLNRAKNIGIVDKGEDPPNFDELKKIKKNIEIGHFIKVDDSTWYDYKKRSGTLGWWEAFEAWFIITAQYLEYKISHYLDKSFESMLGFVSVLPGAFCTFRWKAIEGDPLKSFFHGMAKESHTAKEANMFLAEDRIMCIEILKKVSSDYLLRYIPGCIALTDPPSSIISLIKQRRRWTNGSLFASWFVIDNINMITRSRHTCWRKFFLGILYFHMVFNFIFSLVLVGSLYSSFLIFARSISDEENSTCTDWTVSRIFQICYITLLFIFTLMSITKPIEKSGTTFTLLVILFGILIYTCFGLGLYFFLQEEFNQYFLVLLIMTSIGYYIVPFCIHFWSIKHKIKYIMAIPILIFLSPMYINIIMIYSISNLQDISWGSRATDDTSMDDTRKNLEQFRSISLVIWVSINSAYGYGTQYLEGKYNYYFILILTVSIRVNWLCVSCCLEVKESVL